MKTDREQSLEWFNSKSSLEKTRLTDTNTELVGNVRRYESLTGREIELIWKKETQEYNETFNPEAHSHLIIDFDKHELLLTEAIESNKVETIEEYLNREYPDKGYDEEYYCDINLDIIKPHALQVALSDTVKNYWFKIFQEEQKGQNKHHKN